MYYATRLFLNGEELKELVTPSDVTAIKAYTFYKCTSLLKVVIPLSVESISTNSFNGCSGTIEINSKIIEKDYENSTSWFSQSSFTELIIGNNITRIGKYVFQDNKSLTKIMLPNSIKQIGNYAFRYCNNVCSIEIPNSVESIGVEAFYDCINLKYVILGNGIVDIGSQAFYNAYNLEFISCSSIVPPAYGSMAFWYYNTSYGPMDFTEHYMINCDINVPSESLERYKTAKGWNEHKSHINSNH
jgi:hypothetical protein